jgi:phosphoribosylformylglycinamidine (FGAM) synthase PurS component
MKAENTAKQSVLDTQGKIAEENTRAMSKARITRMENNYKLLADTQAEANAENGLIVNSPSK